MPAPPIYLATVVLGAFLLFLVQPIMGKFILPWFGGGSSVWTTCLLFFQTVLLAGYAYAHVLTTRLAPRRQAVVHLSLLICALFFLPITPDDRWRPEPNDGPVGRILVLLLMTIGLPFLVLSATAPLLQKWFAISRPGQSPYRLYAFSNAGSVAALTLHPFVVEPLMTRQMQSWIWSGGMLAFVVVCGGCAILIWRLGPSMGNDPAAVDVEATDKGKSNIGPGDFWRWIGLSGCGSILLLSTTNEMSQDVTVMPYLWVLPLGIYLISFILCFDKAERYSRRVCGNGFLASLLLLCVAMFAKNHLHLYARMAFYAATLFFGCMVCHGELYRLRPAVARLTAYYLTISAGGAAGGLLVAVVAPVVLHDYYEHQLGLLACAAIVGRLVFRGGAGRVGWSSLFQRAWTGIAIACCVGIMACEVWMSRKTVTVASRNFFGAIAIHEVDAREGTGRGQYLQHGNIVHGYQVLESGKRRYPTGYYGETSGGGFLLTTLPISGPRRVGVIGLGVGTLAVYGRSGDVYRFYEIDPAVIDAAWNHFTFLADSAATIEIARGDGRLALEREPAQQFDVLVLDAFTSDAVPVHLLTVEAFDAYRRHLKPGGVLAFHLSSQHLNLTSVVRAAADHLGLRHLSFDDLPPQEAWWLLASKWTLVSSDAVFLDRLAQAHPVTRGGGPSGTAILWTDDYSSLLPVLQ